MNNKIVSVVLLTGIAVTGFAGISAADEGLLGEKMEQRVDALEAKLDFDKDKKSKYGKRKGLKNLTDEEKTALESMSDEEKQAFFDAKKEEMKAQKEAHKAVIDALIAGETLTADEEAIRLEMIANMENSDNSHSKKGNREGKEIIAKILVGDELTDDEETQLADMQEKRAQREAKMELVRPIFEKLRAGEEITDEEKQILEDNAPERGEKRGHRGGKGHR